MSVAARPIRLDAPLSPAEIAAVARGARLELTEAARARIRHGRRIVEALSERGIRGYGINTGVGALCDVLIDRPSQRALSRNILMSHACGLGEPLGREETRAVMAAEIAGFAKGASGVRLEVVETLLALLEADILPLVPSRGSVGYLTHAAAIGLVLIGEGEALAGGARISGAHALARIGRAPLVLEAKEGLSLVNGTPCSTGLACLAVERLGALLDWADAAAALTYENLGAQAGTFEAETLALRRSDGLQATGRALRELLADSPLLAGRAGRRTQDPLSLRAVPHVHGAARDALAAAVRVVGDELASVTDNPAVAGTPEAPEVRSQAHAVAAALALACDALAVASAELAAISERRIDRLVNPLVSGLPAFLAPEGGVFSGFMIAQYAAAALVAENRRLAMPASLDGGITSALQEDMLTHATPAATKLLAILDNLRDVLAIELLAAAQAYEFQPGAGRAPRTDALYRRIRALVPAYADDRPMNRDVAALRALLATPAFEREAPVPAGPPAAETMRILRAADHRRMPWKNGGGETIEIAVHPPGADLAGFDWRVSMARVAADGPFSVFEGVERTLCILDGAGMVLDVEGLGRRSLSQASAPLAFPADAATTAELVDGAIVDLNVMTRRTAGTHRVARLEPGARRSLEPADGARLIVALGTVHLATGAERAVLDARDAALLEGGAVEIAVPPDAPGAYLVEIVPARAEPAWTAGSTAGPTIGPTIGPTAGSTIGSN